MCPQNGIKHKAAITVGNQCLFVLIAALYSIPCFFFFSNEYGQTNIV